MHRVAIAIVAAALPVVGCGSDHSCSVADTPPRPNEISYNSQTLTWSDVPNATSYNLYLRTVANCDELDLTVEVNSSDQKFPNVHSPYDVTSFFNQCHVCYYFGVTSVAGSCESAAHTGALLRRSCS